MITEEVVYVEAKYLNAVRIKNHANFIFASNSDWVVPAAVDERRFFMLDVSEKRKGDTVYFKAIADEMDNGGREAMLYDLQRRDISGVDLRKFPRNTALLTQITRSMPPAYRFWYELLMAGNVTFYDQSHEITYSAAWQDMHATGKIYSLYLEFAQRMGERFHIADSDLGRQLVELCPGIQRKRIGTGISRRYYYLFTDLEICRQDFENRVKIKKDWGNSSDEEE